MPTELEALESDLAQVREAISTNPDALRPLTDLSDLSRQNYRAIVVDLGWRVIHHALGAVELLRNELHEPLTVVQRAIWEALVTLSYLTKHDAAEQEALIFRAFSAMKEIQLFDYQPEIVRDRKALLQRMPAAAVREAQSRFDKWPRTWSGKTIKEMAANSDVSGYDSGYDYMSAEAHSAVIGERVRLVEHGDGTGALILGREMTERNVEAAANFSRRAVKHAVRLMWHVLDAPKIRFRTSDPDQWRLDSTNPDRK